MAGIHDGNVVHRDINPENTLVRRHDGYILSDDLALCEYSHLLDCLHQQLTRHGGTPEQYQQEYSRRLDVFTPEGVF